MTAVPTLLVLVLVAAPLPPVSKTAIEAQIARLKSPNQDPNPTLQGGVFECPVGFACDAQKAVFDAERQLTRMGKDAFATLIAHGDDKGYSLSILSATLVGYSVGTVCLNIVEDQVDIAGTRYKDRIGADGKYHLSWGYFSKYYAANRSRSAAFKQWYEEHENKTVKEMQIEALEWAIEREKAIGFPREKDKEWYLIPLERQLDDLKKK